MPRSRSENGTFKQPWVLFVSRAQHLGSAEQYLLALIRYYQSELGWAVSAEYVTAFLDVTEVSCSSDVLGGHAFIGH